MKAGKKEEEFEKEGKVKKPSPTQGELPYPFKSLIGKEECSSEKIQTKKKPPSALRTSPP